MNKILLPILLALSFVVLAGCVTQGVEIPDIIPHLGDAKNTTNNLNENYTQTTITHKPALLDAPKKFESVEELKKYLADNTITYNYDSIMYKNAPSPMMDLGIDFVSAPVREESTGSSTQDYSGTNVQVVGVDEADFVKTDGDYIYLIDNERLVIVDAKDANNAKIIFEKKIFETTKDNYYYSRAQPKQMFIEGDKLAIFASVPKKEIVFDKYDITPREQYRDYTGFYVFDITDPKNPELLTDALVLGNYYQSRMIGDVIYFVSQDSVYGEVYPPIVYMKEVAYHPDIYYFDNPQENYVFNTITSYDLSEEKMIDTKSYLMGYSSTLMMSQDNMYIAYQQQDQWCRWCYNDQKYEKERFDTVIKPMLPQSLRDEITDIENGQLSEEKQWQAISDLLKEYFAPALDETNTKYSKETIEQRQKTLREIEDALAEYDAKKQIENSKTIIHKFSVNNGEVEYVAQGDVPGSLLNQFSLDEYDSKLRVATTVDVWAQKRIQYNNVYVLDDNMKTIGKLEQIAKDEKIYAARFMGKRLYLVTFKQIDPFFAIDLSDASNPKILGELKIPGYSSYLHPYSEDIIIGIGKQTEQNEWGGTTTAGVKISLFNVADPSNPKEIDTMEFGDSGSDSAILNDHKAFLLDAKRDLMVLPLKVVKREEGFFSDKTNTWDGAVVVKITKDGFEQYGLVKHEVKSDYWGGWWSEATVQRSLYIDDALYTISSEKIMVNEIAQDMPKLGQIDLGSDEDLGLIPDIRTMISEIDLPFVE